MILVNGRQNGAVSPIDRGLQYGDGLFETIRVHEGRPLLWQQHIARLRSGCERLAMPVPDAALLGRECRQACDGLEAGVLKIVLTRGTGGRGYRPPPAANLTRIVSTHPPLDHPLENWTRGAVLTMCGTRLGLNPALAGLKHLNRLEQVLARSEWGDPEIAEGLMLDVSDNVVEGTMSNVFIVTKGRVITPDLSRSGVAGIMRKLVLEALQELSIPHEVRAIPVSELDTADEIFVCNSLIRIWPVRSVGGHHYGPGTITKRLMQVCEKRELGYNSGP